MILRQKAAVGAGFSFLAAKYGGRTSSWWLVANTPTTGSPSVFCSQKKEPCVGAFELVSSGLLLKIKSPSRPVLNSCLGLCNNSIYL
jgi:hypothetical protein